MSIEDQLVDPLRTSQDGGHLADGALPDELVIVDGLGQPSDGLSPARAWAE